MSSINEAAVSMETEIASKELSIAPFCIAMSSESYYCLHLVYV